MRGFRHNGRAETEDVASAAVAVAAEAGARIEIEAEAGARESQRLGRGGRCGSVCSPSYD